MTTEELNVANPKRVHVEHIYPQKPKAGEKWDGHNKVINRIGNLSLLSARINKELQNSKAEEKEAKYAESKLQLTLEIKDYFPWNLEAINRRQSDLAAVAPLAWPID